MSVSYFHFSNVQRRNLAKLSDDELKKYAVAHPASRLAEEEIARRAALPKRSDLGNASN